MIDKEEIPWSDHWLGSIIHKGEEIEKDVSCRIRAWDEVERCF